MRFLRRRSGTVVDTDTTVDADADAVTDASGRGYTPGKGRPTPKRRDAEGKRRGPAPPPPKTQREAAKLARRSRGSRTERRQDAAERRRRMLAGEEGALMPRDRGPVKAYVRDVVDSRPHLAGLFMPLAGLVLLSVVLQSQPLVQSYVSMFCLALMVAMVLEGVLLGRRVTQLARARFPKETISSVGLGWYAFSRASQVRKLRVPKPRVKRGDPVP